jgi:predicted transcriptional regulator
VSLRVRMRADSAERLDTLAAAQGISRSEWIRVAIAHEMSAQIKETQT